MHYYAHLCNYVAELQLFLIISKEIYQLSLTWLSA